MEAKDITVGCTEPFSTNEVLEFFTNKRNRLISNDNVSGYTTGIDDDFDSLLDGIPQIGLTIIDGCKYSEEFLQTLFFKFVARKELNCVYFSLREKLADLFLIKKIAQGSSEIIQKFKNLNPTFIEGNCIYDNTDIEELFDQPSYEGINVIFLDSLNNIYNPSDKKDNLFDLIDLFTKINNLAKQKQMCIIATLHRKEKKNSLFRSVIKDCLIEQEEAYEMLLFLKGYRSVFGTVYSIKATKPGLHYYAECMRVSNSTINDKIFEFDEFIGIDAAIELSSRGKIMTRYEKWEEYKDIYKHI